MGRLVYIEGLIGSGKSTYTREIAARLNYRTLDEPLDKPHLDRFYTNPRAYAYHLQIHMLHRRIGIQLQAACEALYSTTWDGAIVDRSVFGDAAFEALHHEVGNIDDLDHQTYMMALTNMKLMLFPPTTLVYLDVKPETCLDRIKARALKEDRPYEAGITLEYLQQLSKHYEWLLECAQSGQWPWGHAVEVRRVSNEVELQSPEEWGRAVLDLAASWNS